MFANASKNKENFEEKRLKKAPSLEEEDVFKGREFGKELTNNGDSAVDGCNDEKASISTEDGTFETNVPQFSYKNHKLSEIYADSSLVKSKSLKLEESVPAKYKCGRDLRKLVGEDLTNALQEELRLRRKELDKDSDDHSNFNYLLMQCSKSNNSSKNSLNLCSPEYVGEYAGLCIKWMKSQEEEFKMKTNYIDNQIQKKSINKKRVQQHKLTREDRAQAVDTVIEIHRKYGLVTETLFIAISTIDRYLGLRKEGLRRAKDIEAIGIAALLIASKYEDIYPPALDEMIKLMNKPSTRKEVLEWEFKILKDLVFQITVPTPYRFLERFASTSVFFQKALPLAQYVIELALYDYDIQYNLFPSEIAAVALFAAANFEFHTNKIAEKKKWSSEIAKESSMKKTKIFEYFNTYFIDLAFRVEREYKVNDINIKYPQYQFIDNEPLGIFDPIK